MKSIFNLVLFVLVFSVSQAFASGAEFSKTIKKGWLKSGVTALQITNKFGEVRINDLGGDSVTIRVKVTIDNGSESRAKNLMDKIHINFEKSGNMVIATTTIEEDFRGNNSFSIDYLVNIPKDRDLEISNKYGNVIINDLNAKGSFEVGYGNFTAGKLQAPPNSPISLSVSYGKADIDKINSAELEINYSKLFANEIVSMDIETKYSTFNIQKVGAATIESKYDTYNIEEIGKMSAESKYTSYKIGLVTESFSLETGYGSVRIDKVGPKFSEIELTNSYGGINIGLGNLNYKLKADCDYCEIAYPENRFKGNKSKESHKLSIDGNVGTGGGSVSIISRYGGVKLTE